MSHPAEITPISYEELSSRYEEALVLLLENGIPFPDVQLAEDVENIKVMLARVKK